MTIEQLNQGMRLHREIQDRSNLLVEIQKQFVEFRNLDIFPVRVGSVFLKVPKGALKNELIKQKKALEEQLLDLQSQFDAL